ncbi:hypothetical protein B0H12DRAFT_388597 [Mycena haematopus]|nr:hypothetical protein B0H12DRAFT_388597 [Mycena haematopus]
MSGVLHSHRAQLVGTAVAAAATTAALISLYSALSKRSKRHELDKDVLRSLAQDKPPLPSHPPNEYPSLTSWNEAEHDDLVREQLARNYAFFGDEAMAKIRAGRVVVVGCGGVGSWAAVMLVRSKKHFLSRFYHSISKKKSYRRVNLGKKVTFLKKKPPDSKNKAPMSESVRRRIPSISPGSRRILLYKAR